MQLKIQLLVIIAMVFPF